MQNKDQKFHQSIVNLINRNKEFFNELRCTYNLLEFLFRERLDKLIVEMTLEDFNVLETAYEQEEFIAFGRQMALVDAITESQYEMDYLGLYLGFDITLCRLSLHAPDFYAIKNKMTDMPHFNALINGYYTNSLGQWQIVMLYGMISNWQEQFNNHRLMCFDRALFGMSYKTLKAIKQDCQDVIQNIYTGL